jgi:SAM-dependent methyltransferase
MRNIEHWKPTKYIVRERERERGLYASSDTKYLGIGSRLIASLTAEAYTKYIPQYCKGILADIGCGNVPLYEYYKPYINDVITIDWEDTFHKNDYLDITHDLNISPIPNIEADYFDCVICSDVLEHIYQPDNLIVEFHRIIKPGGILLLNVPFYYWVHEAPHDYYRYTNYTLKRKLEQFCFDIIELQPLGGALAAWIDITSKCLCGTKIGKIPAVVLQKIATCKAIKNLLTYKSDVFPLAYFIIAKKK